MMKVANEPNWKKLTVEIIKIISYTTQIRRTEIHKKKKQQMQKKKVISADESTK